MIAQNKNNTRKIAVLFWLTEQEELQDVYFRQLRISLEKYAKINNLEIQLITHEDDVLETLQEVAGFIGIGSFTENETQQFKLFAPMASFLKSTCPELFDTVKPDTDRMTQLAIDLFLTKGYRKIGFIGGAYLNPDTQCAEMDSREVIFRQTLARRDALDEAFLFSGGNFSVETGYRLAKNGGIPW